MKKRTTVLWGIAAAALLFGLTGCGSSPASGGAQTNLDNGKRLFEQENYAGAIKELTKAIRRNPQMAEAYAYRSRAYRGNNNNAQALTDANEAIRINPRLGLGYFARGNLQSDNDLKIADYNQAIKLDPNYAYAYNNRGNAYKNKNDYDRAIADFNAALRIDPNFTLARNNLTQTQQLLANQLANQYDRTKFTVVPDDFKPASYSSEDLFKAVSASKNLQRASNKGEAFLGLVLGSLAGSGLGSMYVLQYVSDVTFISQNGTTIVFSSDDNVISQPMDIDQRAGLQPGQKVRVYYTVMRAPLITWDVVAIERR